MAVPSGAVPAAMSTFEKERADRIAANLRKIEELGVVSAAETLAAIAPGAAKEKKERKPRAPKEMLPEEEQRRSAIERKKVSYKDDDALRGLLRLPGIRGPRGPPRVLTGEEMQELRDKHGVNFGEDDEDMTASQMERKARGPVDSGKGVRIMGGKVYDSKFGVTCHWCRQKTLAENVTCTHPGCGGGKRIPTSFCKGCLRNRHGEDADEAAASGSWVCPPCRGSCGAGCVNCCNCGPCRKKQGLEPTGQIKGSCREAGFDNAHDYLVHLVTGDTPEQVSERKSDAPFGTAKASTTAASAKAPKEPKEKKTKTEKDQAPGSAAPAAGAKRGKLASGAGVDPEGDTETKRGGGGAKRARRAGAAPAEPTGDGCVAAAGGRAKKGAAAKKGAKKGAAAEDGAQTPVEGGRQAEEQEETVAGGGEEAVAPEEGAGLSRKQRMLLKQGLRA
ncbi:hypothetical protein FOA52_009789 [Chlamydomonas sp. UWO 241]|nr:hypothetical protein FOA52_009789 [Chlamydomonas sp. UWO 241]